MNNFIGFIGDIISLTADVKANTSALLYYYSDIGQITLAVSILTQVLYFVFYIKIFEKAGQAKWKAVVPVYNEFILWKIGWNKLWFIVYLVISLGGAALPLAIHNIEASLAIYVASFIAYTLIRIFFCINLSKSFGKSYWMALVLILFPLVGLAILSLGASLWHPENKMNSMRQDLLEDYGFVEEETYKESLMEIVEEHDSDLYDQDKDMNGFLDESEDEDTIHKPYEQE